MHNQLGSILECRVIDVKYIVLKNISIDIFNSLFVDP